MNFAMVVGLQVFFENSERSTWGTLQCDYNVFRNLAAIKIGGIMLGLDMANRSQRGLGDGCFQYTGRF